MFPGEATAGTKVWLKPNVTYTGFCLAQNHLLLRSASLRAGLRRKEGNLFLLLPSTYEPRGALNSRAPWFDVLGYFHPPLRGWLLGARTSKHLTQSESSARAY